MTYWPAVTAEMLVWTPLHAEDMAPGVLAGLGAHNMREAHVYRAAMEGATYSLRYGYDAFVGAGMRFDRIALTGGGANSAAWRQMVADVFDCPVDVPAQVEQRIGIVPRHHHQLPLIVFPVQIGIDQRGQLWHVKGGNGVPFHRHTVRHRIRRAEAVLGRPLDDPAVRADLWFALPYGSAEAPSPSL